MNILLLYLDVYLILLRYLLKEDMVALIDLQVVTHLKRMHCPEGSLLLHVLEHKVLVVLGEALGVHTGF